MLVTTYSHVNCLLVPRTHQILVVKINKNLKSMELFLNKHFLEVLNTLND